MKLSFNSKEVLALYNMLHEQFGHAVFNDSSEADPRDVMEGQLRQVYNRLRAIIIAGLNTTRSLDPVDSWMRHEKAKVDALRPEGIDVVDDRKVVDILDDDDDEIVPGDDFFRQLKSIPTPTMPRPHKRRGRHTPKK